MTKVDVIIPLYNKEKTIARTLQSVMDQTFQDWNIIVVDDGSTDGGLDVVRQFTDDRIKVISQINQGPGAARNRGVQESVAKYVAFLDADDQWYPWHLENSISSITQSGCGFLGSMYYEWPKQIDMTDYWNKRGVSEGIFEVKGDESPQQVESWILFFHVGTTIIHKDIFCKYDGFYDLERCCFGEDTILFAKLVLNETFQIITPASVRHNRQDSGLSTTHSNALMPALTKPGVILDYCDQKRKTLGHLALARLALRTAHHKARNGFKSDAHFLITNFPEMKQFGFAYYKCYFETVFSRWMPYWVKFKVKVGPPVRMLFKQIAYKLGIIKRPPAV